MQWPSSTKKRASPDTVDSIPAPGSERQPKRAKGAAFRILGREQERPEHHEPLRDPDTCSPGRPRSHKRASSTKPTSSPTKTPSIFTRAQSVPLEGDGTVPTIDFTNISSSPRRSPSKPPVEVRCTPSLPSLGNDQMDLDAGDTAALLHYTNHTQFVTPRPNPVPHYTVNFATPRLATPSRPPSLQLSPLSPLTPSPPPSFAGRFYEMQTEKARTDRHSDPPTGTVTPSLMAGSTTPMDIFQPTTDVPARSGTTTSGSAAGSQSSLTRLAPTSSNSRPSALQGPRRVTRSLSIKVQRVKSDCAGIEDTSHSIEVSVTTTTPAARASCEIETLAPSSTNVVSKPRLGMTSKAPLTTNRSASVSKPPPDPVKLRQTSLKTFVKPKPSTMGGSLTSAGTSSIAPSSSPSKIPLLSSPSKPPSMPQPGSSKSHFSYGAASTGVGTEVSRGVSGRSLTTLSHALDKLVVPPPSRPNTSMGFVRAEGSSEESTGDNRTRKKKAKDDTSLPGTSTTQGLGTTFARPTASSLNRAASMTGLGSTATTRIGGRGGATVARMGKRTGMIGIFGKPGDRASKKPNLPVVEGSPVKGSGTTDDLDANSNASEGEKHKPRSSLQNASGSAAREDDVFMSQGTAVGGSSRSGGIVRVVGPAQSGRREGITSKWSPLSAAATGSNDAIDLTAPAPTDKGKQRAPVASTLNLASSALHALSESLSTLPQTPTPPKAKAVGTRTGLRSSTATADKESPTLNSSVGAGVSNEIYGSEGARPSNGTADASGGAKKSSLKILKRCTIFVDVRTEQGDNAGSLFVDMLKGLGAKIMSRLGRKCTHIVYKNGHPNTLVRYRLLDDPKPAVVGIAWVVECVEKRTRIEEERFKIDVDLINVAGGANKRRRSMLPKHLIPSSPGPDGDISMHMSSEADGDEGANGANGSPTQDPDISIRSREEDDLPPLERARRRRTMLPGGQTRLLPL